MHRLPAILLLLAMLAPIAAHPARAETPAEKTFRHWTAACDNQRACSAFGFATTLDETMIGAWIRLDRDGAADAPARLSLGVSLADGGDSAPRSIALSDSAGHSFGPHPVEEGDGSFRASLPASEAAALIPLLRKTDFLKLTLTGADGERAEAMLSLDGASAAMLWLDDEQQRIGTETALVKKGPKPPSAIPPVPPLPTIHAAPSTAEVEQKLPATILDLAKEGDCANSPESIEPIDADLGDGKRLYGALCGSGAYNFAAQFWILAKDVDPVAASFPLPPSLTASADEGGDPEGSGILVNPFFDEKTMSVHSFAKGRGIGDCGSEGEWIWDGTAFRLSSYALMIECEGVPSGDWPVLWRAEVK